MCISCRLEDAIKYDYLNIVKNIINEASTGEFYANYYVDITSGALRHTSYYGRLNIIKYLVREVNVNIYDNIIALQNAIISGHLDIVKYFVNEVNFHNWNKEIIQKVIENKYKNIDKNIIKYLKYLPIQILYMKINACNKIQNWFRYYLIKKYSPDSNYVKNDIKPRFESMQT